MPRKSVRSWTDSGDDHVKDGFTSNSFSRVGGTQKDSFSGAQKSSPKQITPRLVKSSGENVPRQTAPSVPKRTTITPQKQEQQKSQQQTPPPQQQQKSESKNDDLLSFPSFPSLPKLSSSSPASSSSSPSPSLTLPSFPFSGNTSFPSPFSATKEREEESTSFLFSTPTESSFPSFPSPFSKSSDASISSAPSMPSFFSSSDTTKSHSVSEIKPSPRESIRENRPSPQVSREKSEKKKKENPPQKSENLASGGSQQQPEELDGNRGMFDLLHSAVSAGASLLLVGDSDNSDNDDGADDSEKCEEKKTGLPQKPEEKEADVSSPPSVNTLLGHLMRVKEREPPGSEMIKAAKPSSPDSIQAIRLRDEGQNDNLREMIPERAPLESDEEDLEDKERSVLSDEELSIYFDPEDFEEEKDQDSKKKNQQKQRSSWMGFLQQAVLHVAGVETQKSIPDVQWWFEEDGVFVDEEHPINYRQMYGISMSEWLNILVEANDNLSFSNDPSSQIRHFSDEEDTPIRNSLERPIPDDPAVDMGIFGYAFRGIQTVIDEGEESPWKNEKKNPSSEFPPSEEKELPVPPRRQRVHGSGGGGGGGDGGGNDRGGKGADSLNPTLLLKDSRFWDSQYSFDELCDPDRRLLESHSLDIDSFSVPWSELFVDKHDPSPMTTLGDRKTKGKGGVIPLEVAVLGPTASGKTSLVQRFFFNEFDDAGHRSVIPASFHSKTMTVGGTSFLFKVWDTSGDRSAAHFLPVVIRSAHIAMVTYQHNSRISLESAKKFVLELRRLSLDRNGGLLVALVGTKSDLPIAESTPSSPSVADLAQSFAAKQEVIWIETSSKTGTAVKELFSTVASTAVLAADEAGRPIKPTPNVHLDTALLVKEILDGQKDGGKWSLGSDDSCASPPLPIVPIPHFETQELVEICLRARSLDSETSTPYDLPSTASFTSTGEKDPNHISFTSQVPPPPKRQIMKTIQKRSPPPWMDDKDVPGCVRCMQPFSIFNRKHHCRNCGLIVCYSCSLARAPIFDFGYTDSVRVCDKCIKEVKERNHHFKQEMAQLSSSERSPSPAASVPPPASLFPVSNSAPKLSYSTDSPIVRRNAQKPISSTGPDEMLSLTEEDSPFPGVPVRQMVGDMEIAVSVESFTHTSDDGVN